jgi:hypothetical protein
MILLDYVGKGQDTADTYPRGFLQEGVNSTGPACYLDGV